MSRVIAHAKVSAAGPAVIRVLVVALALVATGCGGADSNEAGEDEVTSPADEATEETAGEATDVADEATDGATPEEEETEQAPSESLERVSLRFAFTVQPTQVPNVYGVVSGIFEEHGFDVAVLEGTGSSSTLQIVAQGADHFGFVNAPVYALAKAEGMPVQNLDVTIQENPAQLVFFCDQDINEPPDLAGKTLAASAGDAVLQLLPLVLDQFDMTLDDLNVVTMAPAGQIAALFERDVDMIISFAHAPNASVRAEEEGLGEICSLDLWTYGLSLLGFGLVTSEQLVAEEPDMVRAFTAAHAQAWAEAAENPDAAVDAVMQMFPDSNREVMEQGFARVAEEFMHTEASEGMAAGCVAPEDATSTIQILQDLGGLETDIPPEDFFNNDFMTGC